MGGVDYVRVLSKLCTSTVLALKPYCQVYSVYSVYILL